MLNKVFEYISQLKDHVDALIIINKDGIIEYSATYNPSLNRFTHDGFVGRHVLEAYPSETEETSNHFRVMKSGLPILNEQETITDLDGRIYTLVNSTFPIEHNSDVIGTIELSVIVSTNDTPGAAKKPADKNRQPLYRVEDIIGQSEKIEELKTKIEKAAASKSPVLIHGDTGTGKELVAQSIHSASARCRQPFISLNCSAIPSSIIESLLFGSVKGTFTGAENKTGLLEMANEGTLFLDELNSMDVSIQAKILKALEEQYIRKVGGESLIHLDVRFIAAMNVNPYEAMQKEMLREDLFYRLSVVRIFVPPLKERREDINFLAEHFIRHYNQSMGKQITGLSRIASEVLNGYTWPGNIRELRNAIEYAFNMCGGEGLLNLSDFPEHLLLNQNSPGGTAGPAVSFSPDSSLKEQVENFEKDLIASVLASSRNIAEAARKLKTSRQLLEYKINKYTL